MLQPSYLPEIQIWLVSGYSRLIESRKEMKVCNTNRQDDVARFSEMTYGSKLQNMSWFCYIHVNTLSQTSMTT